MVPWLPARRVASIQAAMPSSQGQRSSSVSGCPLCIFSTFDCGWNQSPSSKIQFSRWASIDAIVLFPHPDTPITTTTEVFPSDERALLSDSEPRLWRKRGDRERRRRGTARDVRLLWRLIMSVRPTVDGHCRRQEAAYRARQDMPRQWEEPPLTSARDSISRLKQLLHFGAADRMLQPVDGAAHIQLFADLFDQRHDRQRGAGSDADARDADALELGQRGVRPSHNIDRHTVERPRQPCDSPDIGKAEPIDAI